MGEASVFESQPSSLTLNILNGGTLVLSSFRSKPVMIDFRTSWCVPCRQEAADVEAAWQKYKDKAVFIGINIWDNKKDAKDFAARFGASYYVGTDPKGAVAMVYGVTGIPEKYFIDSQGKIVKKYVGPFDEARLSQALGDLLSH